MQLVILFFESSYFKSVYSWLSNFGVTMNRPTWFCWYKIGKMHLKQILL